jgi:hypothetical protein
MSICGFRGNVMGTKSASIAIAALAMSAAAWMIPGSANAFFSAPLVQCQAVTAPATLTGCGSDPLTAGVASIDDEGDLEVSVSGAAASQTYTVTLVGPDGSTKSLPNLTTGTRGNGLLRKAVAFSLGKVGAGNLLLSRAGETQFVTGIAIESSGGVHALADFRPELVSCSAVNLPDAITGCGSDAFKNGQVQFDSVNGDINVQVEGAAASATYAVILRSGATDFPLCTLGPTTSTGAGQCTASAIFAPGTIASGIVVLTRDGSDQAYSGFRVSLKPRPAPASTAGLVACLSATFGSPSTSLCGADPLTSGSAVLGTKGVLNVILDGAAPTTSYEVFFRPINSDGTSDVDTGVAVTTDTSGDGKGSGTVDGAIAGTVGSGTFVVKQGDTDEFLSGFTIK